jgi:hypothetical protein
MAMKEVPGMFNAKRQKLGQTWIEIDDQVYGAKPDERGPIGGGVGYADLPELPANPITGLDGLLAALENARPGDVVYVDGNTKIDCTIRVYIENLVLEIPEGVTLASNRGMGSSRGGMILSDTFATRPLIRVMGPNVRITGLRIAGANLRKAQIYTITGSITERRRRQSVLPVILKSRTIHIDWSNLSFRRKHSKPVRLVEY